MSDDVGQLVDRCLLAGFDGRSATDELRRLVPAGLGGVILFAPNVGDADELARMTAALRTEREDVLIAADEEGGTVTRLEATTGSSYPGNLALGAVDDVALTRAVAESIAAMLARGGINFDLAPVVDVNSNPRNPVIGARSFGADPERVAAHGAAFTRGLQESGVAACAKHFPGHGDTELDSHVALPTVRRSVAELDAVELRPFRAAIEAGVQAIMTAHVRFPALDDVPATLSSAVLRDLLRGELRFDGVVVTDALEMEAVASTVGVGEGSVRSLQAGADLLCVASGHDREPVRRAILDALATGRLVPERLAESGERIQRLARFAAAPSGTNVRPELGREAARRALRVSGEPTLDAPPVVVELTPGVGAVGGTAGSVREELVAREPRTRGARLSGVGTELDALLAQAAGRPLVVVVDEPQRHPRQRAALEHARSARPDAILVVLGVPDPELDLGTRAVVAHSAARVSAEAVADLLLSR